MESQGAKDLLEWLHFARFMQPEHCSDQLPKAEKMEFWAENVRVIEHMITKYSEDSSESSTSTRDVSREVR
jgi:hypothetical protein